MYFKSLVKRTFANNKNQRIKSHDATIFLLKGFRLLGINAPKKYRTAYFTFSIILNLIVCIYLPMSFAITLSTTKMEMGNFLTSLQAGLNVYGCVLKFFLMSFLIRRLHQTEKITDRLDARCNEEDEKDEIRSLIMSGKLIVIFFVVFYYSYSTSTCVTSVIMGAPPYSLYFPFIDWRNSSAQFVVAAIMEYVLINIACTQQVFDDAYPVIYIGIIRAHVRVLLMKIRRLGVDPTKSKQENTDELIRCIIDHKNIIELYDTIHPVISATTFVQFMITAAVASITLINIIMYATISSSIASVCYIVAVAMETLPCCYYANYLMVESDEFSDTIFHSNWVDQDIKFRKLLIFFIQRSQKTITMTAGKLFPITLNSFLGIAKFSFSLYTLLSEMDYNK